MESDPQVTLIAPPASADAATTLDFERDAVTSTTIRARGNDSLFYSVESERAGRFKLVKARSVIREGDKVLATVHRREVLPDKLSLRGSAPLSLNKWLKSPMAAKFPVTFEESGRKYRWKSNNGGKLQLYSEDAESGAIAWFHPSRLTYDNDGGRPLLHSACLSLRPEADKMRETVVISCILVLQKMRAKERAREYRAA
ncbi:hypothetical protein BV22DRAFT_1090506 [Leucogyrophana mollusca]|uniref:Uncharacterized protein n=1 Tax=Leucogyrophana mollusca TaxID=85980 RepID=A0ACB8BFY4_9AGAM|nr:hypothetical protein BV22DRAFT_1090506 [Leucogyrophana mollusca]